MRRFAALAMFVFVALLAPPLPAADTAVAAAEAPASEAPARFDGSSAEAFTASVAAFEAGMGDAAKLAFHMTLAQVRNKLAEQRGAPLSDAEFAAALDGKTVEEVGALAEAAPAHITIEIETSDDT